MPQEPHAFGPSLQYVEETVPRETQGHTGSRSQEEWVPERYCRLIWWTVVWYSLTVTGVVVVGLILSCFLGDFCYYGNISCKPL